MKQYFILTGVFGAAMAHAQASPPTPAKQVSIAPAAASILAVPAKVSAPRQLSAEQKAELRRQLYQYSRLAGKGS